MRISDWSSDVCSYDLAGAQGGFADQLGVGGNLHRRLDVDAAEHDAGVDRGRSQGEVDLLAAVQPDAGGADHILDGALLHGRGWIRVVAMGAENGERLARATLNLNESGAVRRSEEHTSELQSLM